MTFPSDSRRRAAGPYFSAMPFRVTSSDGVHSFELLPGAPLVVGRAPNSDIPIIDPTISRRHAEVESTDTGAIVRDLGSSNGTYVNGTRVESAGVSAGDVITFGKVGFRLQQSANTQPTVAQRSTPPGATVIRQVPVRDQVAADFDKNRQKLATS